MQEQQALVVDFVDYPSVLIKAFNMVIKDPATHLCIFIMLPDASSARIDFIQVSLS